MTYQETLDFLYNSLPVYQKIGRAAINYKLEKTISFCERLGNPHKKFKSIHIAGTNGKGSVSHFLSSILQEQGYNVGLYTSPHLKSFTERIKVNGIEVSEDFVIDFVAKHKVYIAELKPSFFEMTVVMAFEYFANQNLDFVIIETGMGGRLDSTNVIHPILSVITNISLDHQQFLGTTKSDIAVEKAGIIKFNVPVVIGERQDETTFVFDEKANIEKAAITYASDFEYDFVFRDKPAFYYKNERTVRRSIQILLELGIKIDSKSIDDGFINFVRNTGLKGRWQILSESPKVICDTAHNYDGVLEIIAQFEKENYDRLHIVWGTVKDKDLTGILSLLPKKAIYYWCCPGLERGLPVTELKKIAEDIGLKGVVCPSVDSAIQLAKDNMSIKDFLFIGGSNFVVAEIEDL